MNKTTLRAYFFCSLLLLLFQFADAQNRTITGRITDSSGAPLSNVSVQVKGTNTGTFTDANGNYSISVPSSNSKIVFSYTGMEPREVSVGNQTSVNAQLQGSNAALGEVVV